MKGASTLSNSSRLKTVLPTTSNRLTLIFAGILPGTGSRVVGVVAGDWSKSSGGGSGAGFGGSGGACSVGGTISCGGGVGGS